MTASHLGGTGSSSLRPSVTYQYIIHPSIFSFHFSPVDHPTTCQSLRPEKARYVSGVEVSRINVDFALRVLSNGRPFKNLKTTEFRDFQKSFILPQCSCKAVHDTSLVVIANLLGLRRRVFCSEIPLANTQQPSLSAGLHCAQAPLLKLP